MTKPKIVVQSTGPAKVGTDESVAIASSVSAMLKLAGIKGGEFVVKAIRYKQSSNARPDQICLNHVADQNGVHIDAQVSGHKSRFDCVIAGNKKHRPGNIRSMLKKQFPDGAYFPEDGCSIGKSVDPKREKVILSPVVSRSSEASIAITKKYTPTFNWPKPGESLLGKTGDPVLMDAVVKVIEESTRLEDGEFVPFVSKDMVFELENAGWQGVKGATVGKVLKSISNKTGRVKVLAKNGKDITWVCTGESVVVAKKDIKMDVKMRSYVGFGKKPAGIARACRAIAERMIKDGKELDPFEAGDVALILEDEFGIATSPKSASRVLGFCRNTTKILDYGSLIGGKGNKQYIVSPWFVGQIRSDISSHYIRMSYTVLSDKFETKSPSTSDEFSKAELKRWVETYRNIKLDCKQCATILKELECLGLIVVVDDKVPKYGFPSTVIGSTEVGVSKEPGIGLESKTADVAPLATPIVEPAVDQGDGVGRAVSLELDKLTPYLSALPPKAREVAEASAILAETNKQLADLEAARQALIERRKKYEAILLNPKARELAEVLAKVSQLAEEID